jgi:hypothetical protein
LRKFFRRRTTRKCFIGSDDSGGCACVEHVACGDTNGRKQGGEAGGRLPEGKRFLRVLTYFHVFFSAALPLLRT